MNSLISKYSNPQPVKKNTDEYGYSNYTEEDPSKTKVIYGDSIYNKTDKVNPLIQKYSQKKTYDEFLPGNIHYSDQTPVKGPSIFDKIGKFLNDDSWKTYSPYENLNGNKNTNYTPTKSKLDETLEKNPIYNFFSNLSIKTDNALMPGSAPAQPKSQGKIADKVTDIGGGLLSFAAPIPGMQGETLVSAANKLATPLEEKALNKLGKVSINELPKLQQYGVNALRTGAEFGGINAFASAANEDNLQDIGKSGLEGFATGTIMGPVGKLIGEELIPRAFPKWEVKSQSNITDNFKPANDLKFKQGGKLIPEETKLNLNNPLLEPLKPQSNINAPLDIKSPLDNNISALETGKKINQITKLDGNQAQLFNIYTSNLSNIAKGLNLNMNGFYNATKDINAFNPTTKDINIITTEYKKMFANNNNSKANEYIKALEKIRNNLKLNQLNQIGGITQNSRINELNQPLENINPSIGATDRTRSISQIVSSDAEKGKFKPRDLFEKAYTRFVDVNTPIKKVDENTYIKATNSKNVGGTVDHILQTALVDRNGNKIGESLKSIVKDIPKNEEDTFMNYVLQKHNIDRAREGKPVYADFTPEQSMKAVQLIEQQYPEYKALNDRLVKFVRGFNDEWGNKSGLISDDLWNNLQNTYKNYVPTQRSFEELEQGIAKTNGKGFVDQSTPLGRATGSDRDIINPVENIMNLVNRTVRTARYNEVGQDLVKAINKNPEQLRKFAEILPEGEPINNNVDNIVSVLVGGKPVNIQINDKSLLESLQSIHKTNINDIEKVAKKLTNSFKSLVTQKNPVFAVRNIARDIPTAYVNGNVANPFKFLFDLGKAGKDLATNSEIAQKYHAIGGGGSNFFNSNNTAISAKELIKTNPLQKVGNFIEKANNITESAPRLAEFKRELNKTGDIQKALYASNDVTTNFSRGGDLAKHADSFIPYLNAGIQGLDKIARQFKNKPIPTTLKGLVGVTSLTLALDHINKDNPNYQQLDNRTKDNYFLFPKEDGTFVKIPKSRELGVLFGSLFERALRAQRGDDKAFKGYLKNGSGIPGVLGSTVATNIAPANPVENNILSPLIYNLPSNKDFAGRTIVPQPMQDRSPQYQYDEKTSEIGKVIGSKLGELTGLSPKQIDYIIRSYTGVVGQLALPATTKSNYKDNNGVLDVVTKPITSQFIADPKYSNQEITNFYDNLDKLKQTAADKNFNEKIPSKVVTKEEALRNRYNKASLEISKISKQMTNESDIDKIQQLRQKMIEIARNTNKQK